MVFVCIWFRIAWSYFLHRVNWIYFTIHVGSPPPPHIEECTGLNVISHMSNYIDSVQNLRKHIKKEEDRIVEKITYFWLGLFPNQKLHILKKWNKMSPNSVYYSVNLVAWSICIVTGLLKVTWYFFLQTAET